MGKKFPVNEVFFDTWSHSMAYVLGFIYADGSLEYSPAIRGKYVRVSNTDRDIVEKIKLCLDSEHRIITYNPPHRNRKIRYLLRIGNASLYQSLINHGVHPNKSLTIQFPKIPKKYLSSFVRGYFDGDGCVYLERRSTKLNPQAIKRMTIIFTCGNKIFLEELKEALTPYIKRDTVSVVTSRRSFQLRYGTADSIQLFKYMYSENNSDLCMQRKFVTFSSYFRSRSEKIDKKIKNILEYTDGPVAKW